MAIVLNVSLTLNPLNQIAYLADFTGLVDGTQYVISATHLQANTRFTFHGNLDITLTLPPLGVPAPGTVVSATISTPALAAVPPPPATYPYLTKNRLDVVGLDATLEFNPAIVPPHNDTLGAGKFKFWIDTSPAVPTLRQCVVTRAAVAYNAAEWVPIATVDNTGFKLACAGGTLTGPLVIAGTAGSLMVSPATGSAAIYLKKSSSGVGNTISAYNGANARWTIEPGNLTAESGSNTGSDFFISRYSDAGAFLGAPFQINRATGTITLPSPVNISGGLTVSPPLPIASGGTGASTGSTALTGLGAVAKAGDTMTGGLTVPSLAVTNNAVIGTSVGVGTFLTVGTTASVTGAITGGTINSNGNMGCVGTLSAGNCSFGGASFSGNATFGGAVIANSIQYPNWGMTTPAINISFGYDYAGGYLWVVPNGVFAGFLGPVSCDERLKRDIEPIKVDPLAVLQRVQLRAFNQLSTRLDLADGIRHYDAGFVAQQLREVIPNAVIVPPPSLGPDAHLGLDLMPLVAHCVGAIQQLAERLEVLEET